MSNLSKRQKEIGLVVLAVIFLLMLSAYTYLNVFLPAKEGNERAEQTLANDRDILFALQRQEAQQTASASSTSRPMQQQIPVKPLEDLVLLQVQEAEIKSDTYVHDVSFTVEEAMIENPPEHVSNVQAVITELQLEADNYAKIDRFIEILEAMDRIFIVDGIQFTAPGEVRTVNQENDLMGLTVTFHAYFRPDLTDLADEAPKVDAPNPAGKQDPTPYNQIPGMEGDE